MWLTDKINSTYLLAGTLNILDIVASTEEVHSNGICTKGSRQLRFVSSASYTCQYILVVSALLPLLPLLPGMRPSRQQYQGKYQSHECSPRSLRGGMSSPHLPVSRVVSLKQPACTISPCPCNTGMRWPAYLGQHRRIDDGRSALPDTALWASPGGVTASYIIQTCMPPYTLDVPCIQLLS